MEEKDLGWEEAAGSGLAGLAEVMAGWAAAVCHMQTGCPDLCN